MPSPPSMELGGGGGDGESAAKRVSISDDAVAAAGEDRLSALPNDVLVLILLKLTTHAAAQTSVLSRPWRRIWTLLPKLHFLKSLEPHWLRDLLDAREVPVGGLFVMADVATPEESLGVWLPAAARCVSGYLNLGLLNLAGEKEEEAVQRDHFQFPCFEKATSIWLMLRFHGLALPPAGVFTRLTKLYLRRVWFHGPGELGDAVSSPRCPCLQSLTVNEARGLVNLSIHSESLLQMELKSLHTLSLLTLVVPALKELTVVLCFVDSRSVANILAPQLANLEWTDGCDLNSVNLGKMEHLRWLDTSYLVYGQDGFIQNHSCLNLLQRFEGIQTLCLTLVYLPDIENYQYMMEDMTVLPGITILHLMVIANGHAFGASAFHVLRLCTGISRLILQLATPTSDSEAQTICSSDCICNQPADWETEELSLNHLEEVEIDDWRGCEHEVAFVKRLFSWGTKLKEMIVNFYYLTSEMEIKAKELYQIFCSFSRPGVCMKIYLYQNFCQVLYAPED